MARVIRKPLGKAVISQVFQFRFNPLPMLNSGESFPCWLLQAFIIPYSAIYTPPQSRLASFRNSFAHEFPRICRFNPLPVLDPEEIFSINMASANLPDCQCFPQAFRVLTISASLPDWNLMSQFRGISRSSRMEFADDFSAVFFE